MDEAGMLGAASPSAAELLFGTILADTDNIRQTLHRLRHSGVRRRKYKA